MSVPQSFSAEPWMSPEGIEIKPSYGPEDLEGLDALDTLPGLSPFLRSSAAVSAPCSSYAVSAPATHATRCGSVVTAIPPAASRLVAKPARVVCWATGPSVARKT